ncbi:unnamed protein product [Gongylonema pulchrum]|uniref:SET domain-containing protein n=1 Tax=Gongylonema pulchrum TaxID=637853 RepID=A0A183D0C4_9BILA|nr:unnamed protein product [Gongylonema pulchrum]
MFPTHVQPKSVRYDRRVSQCPGYLLFMAKKIELLRLSSNISLCLRKKKIRNRVDISVVNLSNSVFIHGLVQHDGVYGVLTADALTLSYTEKSRLIQLDPVTCARYCNYRFIEGFIACSFAIDLQDQQGLSRSPHYLEFQYHRYAITCGKCKTGKCKFGIPFYLVRNTRILLPLPENTDEQECKCLAGVLRRIKGVSTENENLENILLMNSWKDVRSNLDLQYVLDPYACASYIIDYISKSDRKVGATIEEMVKELRKQNNTLREVIRKISSVHYNGAEILAQEATYKKF